MGKKSKQSKKTASEANTQTRAPEPESVISVSRDTHSNGLHIGFPSGSNRTTRSNEMPVAQPQLLPSFADKEVQKKLRDGRIDINSCKSVARWSPLTWACAIPALSPKSDYEGIKTLLDRGADVNKANGFGMTPLMFAVMRGDTQLAAILINRGADMHVKKKGASLIELATERGKKEMVKLLESKCADVDAALPLVAQNGNVEAPEAAVNADADMNLAENDPLTPAIVSGNINDIDRLIAAGADVNLVTYITGKRCVPLFLAIQGGSVEVINALINAGANVHATDEGWETPLHMAASTGQVNVIEIFIRAGADIDAKSCNGGFTPMHLAAKNNRLDAIVALADAGAQIDALAIQRWTPLYLATLYAHVDSITVLVKRGAVVNSHDEKGCTPLYVAALKSKVDVIIALLKHGADINACDDKGYTPLHVAALNGKVDVIIALLEHGADINACDDKRYTPLHVAVESRHINAIKVLIDACANLINARDSQGRTPLHIATTQDNLLTIAVLLNKGADVNIHDAQSYTPLHMAAANAYVNAIKMLLKADADIYAEESFGRTPLDIANIANTKEHEEAAVLLSEAGLKRGQGLAL